MGRFRSRSAAGNKSLHGAKRDKNDEFYTQINDVSNELRHYKSQLRGKTIYCNCDDPHSSNFFKYFVLNFNNFGLKRLIASHVQLSPDDERPRVVIIDEVRPSAIESVDITSEMYLKESSANTMRYLNGDDSYAAGDFRSSECIALLEQSDIVITNPPFSLFREYVAQLVGYDKQFLVIGNMNAITYKDIFKLIRGNKLWMGMSSGARKYRVPDYHTSQSVIDIEGIKYMSLGNTCWFTNLYTEKRHADILLYKNYTPEEYPTYDNYDAIEVSKVANIPVDYEGAMGVPITFLNKYNPEQFKILGMDRPLMFEITGKISRFHIEANEIYARIVIQRKN